MRTVGYFLLLVVMSGFGESCISNKKHLAYVNSLQSDHDQVLAETTRDYEARLTVASDTIRNMSLRLATRKGESNILLKIRNELRDSINYLHASIDGLSQRSSSTVQNLNLTLRQKESEIKNLEGKLAAVNQALDQHTQLLGTLAGELRLVLQDLDNGLYTILTSEHEVRVSLSDDLVFYRGSNSRFDDKGLEKLQQISGVFQRFPAILVQVTGHTSNAQPRRKSDVDNWNISVVRAANVVRLLIEEYDVSPSQLTAAGKSEFAPLTSNATEEGRNQNSRIEFRLAPRDEDLVRSLRSLLD